MDKQIFVYSRNGAQMFRSEVPWAAISISSEPDWPELSEENRKGLLRMQFYDVSNPNFKNTGLPEELIFNRDHARQILTFVKLLWEKVDSLLVHCGLGMSRSPGVAAAITHCYYGSGSDNRFFNCYTPNILVYRTILSEFHGITDDRFVFSENPEIPEQK